jgi:ectoine hydroxylase-related dioxygenase (phytanoyl-CoA dioxygenase family)
MSANNKLTELQEQGFCVLKAHLPSDLINSCRDAFLQVLETYVDKHLHEPNRGTHRHFLPMPFERPCFAPEFFFDSEVMSIIQQALGERIVADQWGCDVPLKGSGYQDIHVDYRRPLFNEIPSLQLPMYMVVVSFGLTDITAENGAIEIAPGTHTMPRDKAFEAVQTDTIKMQTVSLEVGDVLIRHPWTLHRGTPNNTDLPRPLVTIRYVRDWYADASRDVNAIPRHIWDSLTKEQQKMLRFPY